MGVLVGQGVDVDTWVTADESDVVSTEESVAEAGASVDVGTCVAVLGSGPSISSFCPTCTRFELVSVPGLSAMIVCTLVLNREAIMPNVSPLLTV
jgi:hypothetical protein